MLVYIPIIFPAEGRAHEASWVRGKARRLLLCFASMRSGRHGAPPPVTRNRREELADGEAMHDCMASRKARPGPRNRRMSLFARTRAGRFAGAPPGVRLPQGRTRKARCAEAALRPPSYFSRGLSNIRTRERRGRGNDRGCPYFRLWRAHFRIIEVSIPTQEQFNGFQ